MANLVYRVRKKAVAVVAVAVAVVAAAVVAVVAAAVAAAVAVVECRNRKVGKELAQPAHRPGMLACWQYRRLCMAAARNFAVGRLLPVL